MNSMKIVQFQNGKYAVRKGWLDHKFLIYRNSSLAPYFAYRYCPSTDDGACFDSIEEAQNGIAEYHRLGRTIRDMGKPIKNSSLPCDPWGWA